MNSTLLALLAAVLWFGSGFFGIHRMRTEFQDKSAAAKIYVYVFGTFFGLATMILGMCYIKPLPITADSSDK